MARARELTQQERDDLIRRGHRPVEIWVPDFDNGTTRLRGQEDARRRAEADRTERIAKGLAAAGPADWDRP